MFKKPSWDDLHFVNWCIILLEAGIRSWVHCGHKDMDMMSNNTQVGCGSHHSDKCSSYHDNTTSVKCLHRDPCFHVVSTKFCPNYLFAAAEIYMEFLKYEIKLFSSLFFPIPMLSVNFSRLFGSCLKTLMGD